MIMSVTKEFRFEAAHRLIKHPGKCKHLHGHSYKIEVTVTGEVDDETGMLVDFSKLSEAVNHVLESGWFKGEKAVPVDHSCILYMSDPLVPAILSASCDHGEPLNIFLTTSHPTAEYLCVLLGGMIDGELEYLLKAESDDRRSFVTMIKVWETAKCCATAEWGKHDDDDV